MEYASSDDERVSQSLYRAVSDHFLRSRDKLSGLENLERTCNTENKVVSSSRLSFLIFGSKLARIL